MDGSAALNALDRLQQAHQEFVSTRLARQQAILECVHAHVPLRDIARAAECSHETVRRIAAADGSATLRFAATDYELGGPTVELLLYKLDGYARGVFSPDLVRLQAGTEWLEGSSTLANALSSVRETEPPQLIALSDPEAFALHQVLRLTAMERPSVLVDLSAELSSRYGFPPYRRVDLQKWTSRARAPHNG